MVVSYIGLSEGQVRCLEPPILEPALASSVALSCMTQQSLMQHLTEATRSHELTHDLLGTLLLYIMSQSRSTIDSGSMLFEREGPAIYLANVAVTLVSREQWLHRPQIHGRRVLEVRYRERRELGLVGVGLGGRWRCLSSDGRWRHARHGSHAHERHRSTSHHDSTTTRTPAYYCG